MLVVTMAATVAAEWIVMMAASVAAAGRDDTITKQRWTTSNDNGQWKR
jgi:hypothetical protein